MQLIIVIAIIVASVYYCTGEGYGTSMLFGPPDTLPLDRYDDVDVHVYFYYPSRREEYLGRTTGASSCGSMAHGFADSKNLSSNRNWSYVCCTIEVESDCYRKIR